MRDTRQWQTVTVNHNQGRVTGRSTQAVDSWRVRISTIRGTVTVLTRVTKTGNLGYVAENLLDRNCARFFNRFATNRDQVLTNGLLTPDTGTGTGNHDLFDLRILSVDNPGGD